MPEPTITAISAGLAGKKALENVVSDLYTYLKTTLGTNIKERKALSKIDDLYTQIEKVRMVKTLWQVDMPVDIGEFYCPSHVVIQKKKTSSRHPINKVAEFPVEVNILIEGIAGQGKSIFLRHLCSMELMLGEVIPVFVELRRIQQGETLLDHVSRFLEILGLNIDGSTFKAIAKSGKIMLFCDGFDEIAEADKGRILNELEYLASRNLNTRFIITSRPSSGIQMSPLFTVVKLDSLQGDEYKAIINKLATSEELSNALITQINQHKADISELLCTPLLVTLLLITYKSYQQLPTQLSDFYESIFPVLLQRHDGTKPGYRRARRCSMNDMQYRQVFDAFCFESKSKLQSIFMPADIYKFAENAYNRAAINEDPSNFIQDIVGLTCLLLVEGDEYRFIHKSVQEYFAASYIRSRPDSVVKEYYQERNNKIWNPRWQQELEFLSEIDKYRYNKYYKLPYYCRQLGPNIKMVPDECPTVTTELIKYLMQNIKYEYVKSGDEYIIRTIITNDVLSDYDMRLIIDMIQSMNIYSYVSGTHPDALDMINKDNQYENKSGKSIFININTLVDAGILLDKYHKIAHSVVVHAYNNARNITEYLAKQDECKLILDMEI